MPAWLLCEVTRTVFLASCRHLSPILHLFTSDWQHLGVVIKQNNSLLFTVMYLDIMFRFQSNVESMTKFCPIRLHRRTTYVDAAYLQTEQTDL